MSNASDFSFFCKIIAYLYCNYAPKKTTTKKAGVIGHADSQFRIWPSARLSEHKMMCKNVQIVVDSQQHENFLRQSESLIRFATTTERS